MPYTVEIKPSARREIRDLPLDVRRRVDEAILALEVEPRPAGCVKLAGFRDHYRDRVGEYGSLTRSGIASSWCWS